ncbi:MAG: response regulator, partial [Planctomycetes bacterium]|nr:response regulator [Planctomycetota bacterium]
AVDDVIAKATARDRAERFADAGAFARALDRAAGAPSTASFRAAAPAPRRALVVDGDPASSAQLAGLVESLGLTAVPCRDAEAAISEARRAAAALVVIALAGTAGLEAMKRLRGIPLHERTPVLLVAPVNDPDVAGQALEAGADDFLPRPVSAREFRARAMRLIRIAD